MQATPPGGAHDGPHESRGPALSCARGEPAREHRLVHVEVAPPCRDPEGDHAARLLSDALGTPVSVRFVRGYVLACPASRADAEAARAGVEVLADPVTQAYAVDVLPPAAASAVEAGAAVVTVMRRAGVTDPVQGSCLEAFAAAGIDVTEVRTVRRFVVGSKRPIAGATIVAAVRETLANEVIEEIRVGVRFDVAPPTPAPYRFVRTEVPIRGAGDETLQAVSARMCLSLTLLEMQAVRDFYVAAGREPTDVELETVAQTWSEHCKHKTLAGAVRFTGEGGERRFENLLKETVFEATRRLDRDDCLSVFVDNAGVIAFDDEHGVCMKVETHNHPSAIEPYGGAGTGIGGVVRDILGTGLGARPVMNTDVFCFAPPDTPPEDVPNGCLHPRRVLHGVVGGVRDYGNRMGIPTASGGLFFDERYVGNPLVYCGTVGILPRRFVDKAARPGDRILAVGGRTGRDGIHGATFSSAELTEESETVSAGAVQIGNPIEEKRVLDGLLVARDAGLLRAVTDCGAGGFSSAVGEMGEETGARVELARAPLKYEGLSYSEIWISEAQERMVLAVAPGDVDRVRAIFEVEGVETTDLGEFTGDGRLVLTYDGTEVADLPMSFLHDGLPRVEREARWDPPPLAPFPFAPGQGEAGSGDDAERARRGTELRAILGAWNVCSKEWVVRQYDHEVQGGSALKPLVGVRADGPGDASAVTPLLGNPRGVAVASGLNPRLGDVSPYDMATNAVDEALRNLAATGAPPFTAALLDNFSWGNASKPDRLGSLVRASEGLRDAALAYGTPFVSGKDSLNNEFQAGGRTIAIPPTLLVSAFTVVPDVRRLITMDLAAAGNLLYVVGVTRPEMGGSHLALVRGLDSLAAGPAPRVRFDESRAALGGVHRATAAGLVRACHDASEGGLAVAVAEMAFAGCLGADVELLHAPFEEVVEDGAAIGASDDALLFAESPGRFVCEVAPADAEAFEAALGAAAHARVGRVTDTMRVRIHGLRNWLLVDESIEALREAFTAPLRHGGRPGAGDEARS